MHGHPSPEGAKPKVQWRLRSSCKARFRGAQPASSSGILKTFINAARRLAIVPIRVLASFTRYSMVRTI